MPGADAPHNYVRAWTLFCFLGLISTQTFRRALTASADSCAEIKSATLVAKPVLAEFGGRCRKAMFGVCPSTTSLPVSLQTKNRALHNSHSVRDTATVTVSWLPSNITSRPQCGFSSWIQSNV